jgi:MFS family permease
MTKGTRAFLIIWSGQLVSLVGTGMTRFALLIWAWGEVGDATTLALLGFFSYGPYVIISPLAGVIVDRVDRRLLLVLSDLGAGLVTAGLLILFSNNQLEVGHLYLAQAMTSVLEAFQVPAYSASITMLVRREQYGRASGLNSLAESASTVLSPILAGLLLAIVDIDGVMIVDLITFLVGAGALLVVRIPKPPVEGADGRGRRGALSRLSFGFRYILARRGLTGLMLMFAGIHFFASLTYFSILPALILARSGGDQIALATVEGALGVGGIAGSIVIGIWGGPKRRIHAILMGTALSFLAGDFFLGMGQQLVVWTAAAFMAAFFIPPITSAQQAIWQSKVPPQLQGRVFSAKSMMQMATFPLGFLLSGPLADQLFEPIMASATPLSRSLSGLVGTGPGSGIGLMFICTSILGSTMALSGYLFPAVRNVETDLPDHVYEAGEAGG